MKKSCLICFSIFFILNLILALEITKLDVSTSENQLFISFYLKDEFPVELMESIHSGIETNMTFKIRIIKKRKLWFDKKLLNKVLITKINFDPVTKQYKSSKMINDTLISSLETDSELEMETWLRKFEDIYICPTDSFRPGTKYSICIEGSIFPKYLLKIIPQNYKITFEKEFTL